MQYEESIKTYERIKTTGNFVTEKKNEKIKEIFINTIFFFTAVLISRVIMINKSAPFGVAFLITILMSKDSKLSIIAGLGVEIGYLLNIKLLDNSLMYITMVPALVFIALILGSYIKKRAEEIILIGITLIIILFYTILINQYTFMLSMGNVLLEGVEIVPIYLIMSYGVKSFKKIKTKHLFSNEEIVSMSILLSLVLAGTWNLQIFNISILNILSITSVVIIAYICGTSIGATAGIAMGVIVGMSTNNIFAYATILGLCGLITGIFREGGKLIAAIASIVVFSIMKIYISSYGIIDNSQFVFVEGILAVAIFILIPEGVYVTLAGELDTDKKGKRYEEGYVNKVKGVFTERLDKFSEVLVNMSGTLSNLADNDKLDMNSKSSALVENLANRVCEGCDTCNICWGKEMLNTYKAFEELLEGAQNKCIRFPATLDKKCMKKGSLIRNTEDIINKYIISEMWRTRLAEGRELIANQFVNMAKSVDEIMYEFSSDFNEDREVEKKVLTILDKYDVDAEDVFAIKDKNERLNIQVSCKSCNGSNMCARKILPLINECTDSKMRLKKDGCRINPESKKCIGYFEEVPKYEISTSVSRLCKDKQEVFGDSYIYGEVGDGSYMMAISDGMGSGPQAGRESKAVVELIEKFALAGFSRSTAINTVNSIMSLKFSEEEKFSTVDLSSINLYSGEVDFMKVGAVASFIKSGDTIDVIKSKTLPIGVLDEADIEVHSTQIRNGDLIVMITDGIVDCNEDFSGRVDWILDFLCRNEDMSIKELSKGLVNKAKEIGKNKVNDDMTVMVSKVRCV